MLLGKAHPARADMHARPKKVIRTRAPKADQLARLEIVSTPCVVVSVPELCFPLAALHLVSIQR
jgi:hypothetical protein